MRNYIPRGTEKLLVVPHLTNESSIWKLIKMSAATTLFTKIINDPLFLSAFFSWFIAQLLKFIIEAFKKRSSFNKDLLLTLVWATGGMPSSHSSMVTALATAIAFQEGLDSPLFFVALFYGLVTIRDAMGVRRAAGAQAKVLNQLGKELNERFQIPWKPVKEIHGHSAAEVFVGIFLGFFIAVAFCNL